MRWGIRLGLLLAALLLVTAAALADDSWVTSGDYQYLALDQGGIAIMKYTGADKSLTVPATLDGQAVKVIGELAFSGNSGLTSVVLPEGVTRIDDGAFFTCDGLTSVTLPQSLTTLSGSPFYGCEHLETIALPAGLAAPESNPFVSCPALTGITVAAGNTALEVRQGLLYSRADSRLVCWPQGLAAGACAVPAGTLVIGREAFMLSDKLTSVTLPDSVTAIRSGAFRFCDGLTSINLPASVTVLEDSVFEGCSSLAGLTLPAGITELPSFCLRYCDGLTRLVLPEGIQRIGICAMEGCSGLREIVLPASLREIGDFAFNYCESLARVRFTGTQEEWSAVTVNAFNDALTSAELRFGQPLTVEIDLPDDLVSIGSAAFADLKPGATVRFHDSVAEIAIDAFPAGVIFIAPAGSYAAVWGTSHGYTVLEPED